MLSGRLVQPTTLHSPELNLCMHIDPWLAVMKVEFISPGFLAPSLPSCPRKAFKEKIGLALYLLPVFKKKKKIFPCWLIFASGSVLLKYDERDVSHIYSTMVTCPPPFLFCLSYVLHSILSFSLDDVRKLQRTHDLLLFQLARQRPALCISDYGNDCIYLIIVKHIGIFWIWKDPYKSKFCLLHLRRE